MYLEAPADLDALVTPSQAARAAGVSKQLFNWWRISGKVKPTECGRYRLREVLNIEKQMRRSPQSHRV